MSYTTPTITEWMKAREYLVACNLPIDPDMTGSKQDLEELRKRITLKYSSSKSRRILSNLRIYLEQSKREQEIWKLFKEVSELMYQVQRHERVTFEIMEYLSGLSNEAIVHLKRRHVSDVALLTEIRNGLKETLEYLGSFDQQPTTNSANPL